MMSFLAFFLFLSFMPESLNLLDTNSYIEKCLLLFFYCLSHFISIEDPELIQSEMILSFLYLQFNIDIYYLYQYRLCMPLFLLYHFYRVIWDTRTVDSFFFVLSFRTKAEESFIMIWITAFSFSFFFIRSLYFFNFLKLRRTLYNITKND